MSRRRLVAVALATFIAATVTAGCGRPEQLALEELRDAISRTEHLAKRFIYTETAEGRKVMVQGVVEDDLRYKARLLINQRPLVDEVVYDDGLAVRFLERGAIGLYLDKSGGGDGRAQTLEALSNRHWVFDRSGAPPVLPGPEERPEIGGDPIHDALHIWEYLRDLTRRMPVWKFNADALDYRPKEDPFPKPEDGSGVTRYDFRRLPVPRKSDVQGANQVVPDASRFRKMAIYVKDGHIIEVRETIDVAGRLDDIERNYGVKLPGTTVADKVAAAVKAINAVLEGQGEKPMRIRDMTLRLDGLGADLNVALPDQHTEGDLSLLINRGGPKAAPDGEAGPDASDPPSEAGDPPADATASGAGGSSGDAATHP